MTNETLALAVFAMGVHCSVPLMDDDDDIENAEDVRGWFDLSVEASRIGTTPDALRRGFDSASSLGRLHVAEAAGQPLRIYAEMATDLRRVSGFGSATIRSAMARWLAARDQMRG
ncbi:hypothetical protein HOY34_14925 [Xinfangfangia sp. D13-10-4-6]|uniref:hypothetical protein n=1 Tax=Pseudogemmobacter hezensis TaxID=2737662 RepID=UPI001554688C|nr:hypothetical protein [Pseudogemmobacter hezensis]NPD16488.1 hypothetical protein [Pseudogemmobacter hezensis]